MDFPWRNAGLQILVTLTFTVSCANKSMSMGLLSKIVSTKLFKRYTEYSITINCYTLMLLRHILRASLLKKMIDSHLKFPSQPQLFFILFFERFIRKTVILFTLCTQLFVVLLLF